jgi:hypothetical protein
MTHDEMVYADQMLRRAVSKLRVEVRRAVADYMRSEGCSCCQAPGHDLHEKRLGKLLKVPKYDDGSGYNFAKYRSPK